MASASLQKWRSSRSDELNEIENAHVAVGGSLRGRRYATRQKNHAYAMMVSSHFQGFCRDLHSEAAIYLVSAITRVELQPVLRNAIVQNRKLDSGNPNSGNLGSHFNRLGLDFWGAVKESGPIVNRKRQGRLDELNVWRNAIAHNDFSKSETSGTLLLRKVKAWRTSCDQLADRFDAVIRDHLNTITGQSPW